MREQRNVLKALAFWDYIVVGYFTIQTYKIKGTKVELKTYVDDWSGSKRGCLKFKLEEELKVSRNPRDDDRFVNFLCKDVKELNIPQTELTKLYNKYISYELKESWTPVCAFPNEVEDANYLKKFYNSDHRPAVTEISTMQVFGNKVKGLDTYDGADGFQRSGCYIFPDIIGNLICFRKQTGTHLSDDGEEDVVVYNEERIGLAPTRGQYSCTSLSWCRFKRDEDYEVYGLEVSEETYELIKKFILNNVAGPQPYYDERSKSYEFNAATIKKYVKIVEFIIKNIQ